MTSYRRNFIPGGSYFFTATLANRTSNLLVKNIDLLKESIKQAQKQKPFDLIAIVVMPEHLHCIWTLPPDDADYPNRWKIIKSGFSKKQPKTELQSKSQASKGERGIWQRRYWEHTIRDDMDMRNHIDYIHFNPVKHGYVTRVKDWPYSTFHRYVNDDLYPSDWAGTNQEETGDYGE